MPPVVTLLTDFGMADGFVGIMKGVILQRAPTAALVDLSHDIPPQDVRCGALVLRSATRYFPDGTIHLAVVDPGVGSSRRALCIVTDRAYFVGPDNGILSLAAPAAARRAVYSIERECWFLQPLSRTFHGRDIFAPVAGLLAAGLQPAELGPSVESIVELPWQEATRVNDQIAGEIIYVDRFGNLITNISADVICNFSWPCVWVKVADQMIRGIVRTYSDVEPGGFAALVSSWGFLEIAVREGNAARTLGVGVGTPVTVVLQSNGG